MLVYGKEGGFEADDGKPIGDPNKDVKAYRSYSRFSIGIALDASSIVNVGMGYTYSQGDMCILIFKDSATSTTTSHHLPVIGQSGKYIIVGAKQIKSVLVEADECVYEIYTPSKAAEQDFFYEVGKMYKVNDPSTITRSFSVSSETFVPECHIIDRVAGGSGGTYRGYAMSPNDLHWRRWVTDFGRASVLTDLGQTYKPLNISYSDVFLEGSSVNGVSAFHALNEVTLPEEMGVIRKLQLTSKAQKEGTVLLAIGGSMCASIYLGETELVDKNDEGFVAKSENVIGNVNVLKGAFGTQDPTSVKEFDGSVYWYDRARKAFVRYASNGLMNISGYKFKRGTWLFSEEIKKAEIRGKTVMINGGIDPYHKEYLVQKQEIVPDEIYYCKGINRIQLSHDPVTEFPARVKVLWTFSDSPRNFDWKYFNASGILIDSGRLINITSPYAQYINNPPGKDDTSFYLKLKARSDCGGGNYSEWATRDITLNGEAETTQNTGGGGTNCTPLSWVDSHYVNRTWQSYTGETFYRELAYQGTNPIVLTIIEKPDWLSIWPAVNGIEAYGIPTCDSPLYMRVAFKVENCDSTFLEVDTFIATGSQGMTF